MFISCFFFFKQKTAYEMRISDWSSDVCSSDLHVFIDFHELLELLLLFGVVLLQQALQLGPGRVQRLLLVNQALLRRHQEYFALLYLPFAVLEQLAAVGEFLKQADLRRGERRRIVDDRRRVDRRQRLDSDRKSVV